MKWFAIIAASLSLAVAQQPPVKPPEPSASEMEELKRAFAIANTSEVEVLRVIQHHLAVNPASTFQPFLEHRAAEAAIALHNDQLVIRYGEPSLARQPDDIKLLPAVTRSLLSLNSKEGAERALKYARRTQQLVREAQQGGNPSNVSPLEWRNQTDRMWNQALIDDARATGILGRPEEALATAKKAFETYPDAAAAREIAWWLEQLGKTTEAIRAMADAFTIPDTQDTDAERSKDRARLGELYRKAKGSEDGLGAICLAAYDRNTVLLKARDVLLHQNEPNAGRTNFMDFTLSGVDGKKLEMASLKGKVVVMDLWATWCVPCREQHPLYEQVKQRFHDNPSVVFLSIDSEPDHSLVKDFLAKQKWEGPAYFEDGLATAFLVDSLPTTIVVDRNGQVFTHLNGYDTERKQGFVDLLTQRIHDALASSGN